MGSLFNSNDGARSGADREALVQQQQQQQQQGQQLQSIDDALGALDALDDGAFGMPPATGYAVDDDLSDHGLPVGAPNFMRKRSTSVGGEDSVSVLSDDSGFGSVDHRTSELLETLNNRTDRNRGSPSASALSFAVVDSREERRWRRVELVATEAAVELKKKLELRVDRGALEKRKILQKRQVVHSLIVRMPTNHLHTVQIDGSYSDDTLADLFHSACMLGGLRWTNEQGNVVGVKESEYFFAYHHADLVWVPEDEGGTC
jgi:hypothetical protein